MGREMDRVGQMFDHQRRTDQSCSPFIYDPVNKRFRRSAPEDDPDKVVDYLHQSRKGLMRMVQITGKGPGHSEQTR